jgi:hypothetical protein
VLDTGSYWPITTALRQRIETGEVVGPRILTTGEILFPKGGAPAAALINALGIIPGKMPEVDTREAATIVARKKLDEGADALKVYAATRSSNGLVVGALAGAGTMFGMTAVMYARCDAGCDAPARGPMFLASMAFGAGIGTAAGWIIDKIHKGTDQLFPAPPAGSMRIGVAPLVSTRQRGFHVSLDF